MNKYTFCILINRTATLLKVWLSQRSLMLCIRILPLSPSTSEHARVNSAIDNFLPSDCEVNQTILKIVRFCISLLGITDLRYAQVPIVSHIERCLLINECWYSTKPLQITLANQTMLQVSMLEQTTARY